MKVALIVIVVLLVLLGASATGNALLFSAWQDQKDRATTAEANLGSANEATKVCNQSITDLEKTAYRRGEVAGKARAEAKKRAEDLEKQAQAELSTPATTPGDDCKSAQDRVDRILLRRSERLKP